MKALVLSRVQVLIFAAAAGLILHFAVPPFLNPDEPQHFSIVVRKAWGDEKKGEIERGIIKMMSRSGWWRLVGMGEPAELPESLSEIRFISWGRKGDIKDLHRGLLFYHRVAGTVIGPLAGNSLERFYVLTRALSYLLFMAALLVMYGALQAIAAVRRREREPDVSAAAARGAPLTLWEGAPLLFILFIPQVLIIALSANPDPWCIFLGAVFFRSAFAVVRGEAGLAAYLGLFGTALAGALSDHSVLVFVPLAVLSSLFAFRWKNTARSALMVLSFTLGAVVLAFIVVQAFPLEVETNVVYLKARVTGALKSFGTGIDRPFFSLLVESFYLRFGWMGFGAPRAVVWGWKAACAAAAAGFVFLLAGAVFRRKRWPGSLLKVLAFAAAAVGTQILLTRLATTSLAVIYAQGRYLYPMLLPIAVLFVAGFREFFDAVERGAAGAVRAAGSIFTRETDKTRLSRAEADGFLQAKLSSNNETAPDNDKNSLPDAGGGSGGETRRMENGKEGTGTEADGLRENDGFAGVAGRGGRAELSDVKEWAAPGDALVDAGPAPPRLGKWAVLSFILLELLVLGWAVYALIVPTFHLTLTSPHPGI